jgi:protein ImuA
LLPEKGFRSGTLVEWLVAEEGAGAATLALDAASRAGGGSVVVLDRDHEFYPPAAVRLGIGPARLIVLHTTKKADHDWALDQALRCPAVAAVMAWPDSWGKLDGRTFRRLQLAAEQGGGLGLWIRPDTVRAEPSWADVRLLVEPLPSGSRSGRKRRLKVCVLRCRGGGGGGARAVEVEINDDTHPLFG